MIPSPTPMEPPRSEDAAGPRPTLLPWAIRVSLVLTAMGFATSYFLSQTLPGSGMASTVREWRVVAGGGDPETTGSLGGDRPSPRDVRLDPCKASADLRLR